MKTIDAILRTDFCSFVERSFNTLNPGTEYMHNWHIEKIAEKLEEAESGKVKRLVINMPPRYLKSLCVAVSWPAFLLGNDPSRRIIAASHSSSLSVKHSVDTRKIMQSEWYKNIFPNLSFANDQNEKSKFMTTESGFRLATSVGGAITGEGGNFLIIDDPLSPEKAMCSNSREQTLRWFDQTFSTRLDSKKSGVIIVVMQRLHEEDLSGSLLEREGWDHLCLPAVNDNNELLHEEREGWSEIRRIKSDMGEYGFSAQYLQKPYCLDGGIIKNEWLQFYGEEISQPIAIYQSWDTAIKTSNTSDYSVCLTVAETKNGFYIIDALREKLAYPDLKRRFLSEAEKWKPDAILVEDKASGQSLIQDLRMETTLPIIAQMPKDDKVTRLAGVSPMIEAGKLFLPKRTALSQVLTAELLAFPSSRHDDMVDALSQFLTWVKNKNYILPNIRRI